MSNMKLDATDAPSSVHAKLEHWTTRELQLNMLHEEIIHKREALLRTSRNLLHTTARLEPLQSNAESTIRNDKLVKDIKSLEEMLMERQREPISPSFAYLQANYKSMVENMFPIWQQSLQEMPAAHTPNVNTHS